MDRLRNLLREPWRMALAAGVTEALVIAVSPSPVSCGPSHI
jgi:hypothetical protein